MMYITQYCYKPMEDVVLTLQHNWILNKRKKKNHKRPSTKPSLLYTNVFVLVLSVSGKP